MQSTQRAGLVALLLALFLLAAAPPAVLSAATVAVPAEIPADFSRDVTAELNAFFAALPAGATAAFPAGGKYRIEGTLLIDQKRELTVDGNGAVLRAFDPGQDAAKQEDYKRWRELRTRTHLRVRGCEDLRIQNLEIHGAHPNAGKQGEYDADREAQHGIELDGGQNLHVENVHVHDVYGDCIYIRRANGVTLRKSKLHGSGRQCLAIVTGENVLIENNDLGDSRRGVIDIEPYGKEWETGNICIVGNRLGASRLLLLPMGGSGRIGAVFIADNVNTEPNGTPAILNKGTVEQRRGPLVLVNNRFAIGGSSASGLRIQENDGVFLAGNRLEFPARRAMTAIDAMGSQGVMAGNVFAGAATLFKTPGQLADLENSLAANAEPAATDWRFIAGGIAVRTQLADSQIFSLLRAGPEAARRPQELTAFGLATDADFAWAQIKLGKIVDSYRRSGTSLQYQPTN